MRMDADERYTGRGVTIAFLDSGFYAHKDLTEPVNRIVAYHNIFSPADDISALQTHDVASWHGMMTSVVAAGNGYLSEGLYRSIAPEAKVVLVKIGKTRTHSGKQHRNRTALGACEQRQVLEFASSTFPRAATSNSHTWIIRLCRLVEEVVKAGMTVVCAVGNAGLAPGHPVLPPASSPSSISVGGLDDQNSLDRARRGMYRSSYGPTIDGLQKPEVIAPGIWVAGPILPHTPTAAEAIFTPSSTPLADDQLKRDHPVHMRASTSNSTKRASSRCRCCDSSSR